MLKAYYPQDYTPYEDYLGTYYMYYREYEKYNEEEDKVEFRPGYMAVELQQKVAGESFVLTSDKLETTAANIVITYDKATGKLIIKPQNVTVMGYPGALVIGFEQGFLPAHYGLYLGNLAVLTDMETGLIGISGVRHSSAVSVWNIIPPTSSVAEETSLTCSLTKRILRNRPSTSLTVGG